MKLLKKQKPIPPQEAKAIAMKYKLDECIILGRRAGQDGMDTIASYGTKPEHVAKVNGTVDFIWHQVWQHPRPLLPNENKNGTAGPEPISVKEEVQTEGGGTS